MVSGSDRETVWIMVKAAKVIFGSVKYWAFTLLALQQLSKYLIHISQNDICCFTCFRKYRKTLRAEHMNVSLVTQHGTISGKVSLYLYLYLLTSWFLSRSAFLSNMWFHWYTNEDIYAKILTQQLQDGSTPQRWRNTTGNRCRWKNTTASPLRCSLAS